MGLVLAWRKVAWGDRRNLPLSHSIRHDIMLISNEPAPLGFPRQNRLSALIIDESPSNLLLVRFLLEKDGLLVDTAENAEQALIMLETLRPSIILLDIQIPGMDALDFAQRVKTNPELQHIPRVALSADDMPGDEQRAMAVGCHGYLTKPIDTRTLPSTIRIYIERAERSNACAPGWSPERMPPELETIRQGFIADSTQQSLLLLSKRLEELGDAETRCILHGWAGTGGTLGFPEVTRYAREAQDLLRGDGLENRQLGRMIIQQIGYAFEEAGPAEIARPIPAMVTAGLNGARVAMVGLNEAQLAQISDALEHADAFCKRITGASSDSAAVIFRAFDLIVYRAPAIDQDTWSMLQQLSNDGKPVVISANRQLMPAINAGLQGSNIDFVLEPWDLEELLLRASLLLSRKSAEPSAPATAPKSERPMVLVADDDPTITSLLKATLHGYGIDCATAADGREALASARSEMPDVIVLATRMPLMDGFEVLSALRQDKQLEQIPVILLSSLQHETDVIRGFGLGADDYVIKPFSPLELVARLRRLLRERQSRARSTDGIASTR